MSSYPYGIDNSSTLAPQTVDGYITSIDNTNEAVEAIETELGLLPSGVYASVRTRLDILEARINNPFAPAPNVNNPFYIGGNPVSGVSIQAGFGDPSILLIPAIPGSLYLREDGSADQGLYVFGTDGYWHQVISSSGGSAVVFPTITVSANYSVDSIRPDYLVLCKALVAINVTLPQPNSGRQLIIKDASGLAQTNNITILPHASESIDGAPKVVISTNYSSITLMSDGVNWYIN
jgi:hypothetical protein